MWTGRLNTNFFQSFSSLSESAISSVSWHALSLTRGTLAKRMIFLAELTFLSPWVIYFDHRNLLFRNANFFCSSLDWFTLSLCTVKLTFARLINKVYVLIKKKKTANNETCWKHGPNEDSVRVICIFFCVQKWNIYKIKI